MSASVSQPAPSARTLALLQDPILPMLLRLAWPNMLVMLAQASTGLIETFWVARLGTGALAGMALVFPGVMLMQMVSGGAMGGGISSAIARALGARRPADADALVLHAVVINVALGAMFSALVLAFGPTLYRALGGTGDSLAAALAYSNVVFAGTVILWLSNALGERHSRDGQHADPGAGDDWRGRGAGAAFALPDLRLGTVSTTRGRRRRRGRGDVLRWQRLGAWGRIC